MLEKLSNILTRLELENNPIECDCTLYKFVQKNQNKLFGLTNISCFGEKKLLINYDRNEICPSYSKLIIIICSIVTVIALLIGFFTAFYFRYKTQIKVFLFSKNLCLSWFQEEEKDRSKIYDVFLSFSNAD